MKSGVFLLFTFVDLYEDLASLRICCLFSNHFGGRCIVLRSLDLKMQENTQEIREMGAYQYI